MSKNIFFTHKQINTSMRYRRLMPPCLAPFTVRHEGHHDFTVIILSSFIDAVWFQRCQINKNQSKSQGLLDRIMWSGSCIAWSFWPICLYWQWYWGGNPVSRPAPVRQAACLVSLLYPAIISIICSAFGLTAIIYVQETLAQWTILYSLSLKRIVQDYFTLYLIS